MRMISTRLHSAINDALQARAGKGLECTIGIGDLAAQLRQQALDDLDKQQPPGVPGAADERDRIRIAARPCNGFRLFLQYGLDEQTDLLGMG